MAELTKKSGNEGAILIRPGDTLSAIAAQIYKIPAAKTRPHWDEFYRRGASGDLVPLKDPNKLISGETIYHRPHGVKTSHGLKAGLPSSGGLPASEGVKNAKTFRITDDKDLRRIKELLVKAKSRIHSTIQVLDGLAQRQDDRRRFKELFTFDKPDTIARVKENYKVMLKFADNVEWHVQTQRPTTTVSVSDVYAFAVYRHYIAIYPPNFYAANVNDLKRVEILIHELAHYAFDAGHTMDFTSDGGAVFRPGVSAADAYASFAMGGMGR